jgi:hypothetical protein
MKAAGRNGHTCDPRIFLFPDRLPSCSAPGALRLSRAAPSRMIGFRPLGSFIAPGMPSGGGTRPDQDRLRVARMIDEREGLRGVDLKSPSITWANPSPIEREKVRSARERRGGTLGRAMLQKRDIDHDLASRLPGIDRTTCFSRHVLTLKVFLTCFDDTLSVLSPSNWPLGALRISAMRLPASRFLGRSLLMKIRSAPAARPGRRRRTGQWCRRAPCSNGEGLPWSYRSSDPANAMWHRFLRWRGTEESTGAGGSIRRLASVDSGGRPRDRMFRLTRSCQGPRMVRPLSGDCRHLFGEAAGREGAVGVVTPADRPHSGVVALNDRFGVSSWKALKNNGARFPQISGQTLDFAQFHRFPWERQSAKSVT